MSKTAPTFVVAMDSFKGGLSAPEACRVVAAGLREVCPDSEIRLKPMADGGEGTADAMLSARPDGIWVPASVTSPLPARQVPAGFAWFPSDATAVVEMALASGLPLLSEDERNPLLTTTYGTGELILAAARHGAQNIVLAIGGSATVDGGMGAASALGWRFLDVDGQPLPGCGGSLTQIASIEPPPQGAPKLPSVTVLCDVTNPLFGEHGAAAVFGPQKGASPAMVAELDNGLRNLAERVRAQLGMDVHELEGGGAAGGLGAGAAAFMRAQLKPGIATILEVTQFDSALHGADWCITGEGSFDNQSLHGKVVSGIAAAAQARNVPTVVLAGRVAADPALLHQHGIHAAHATHAPEMPLAEVLRRESELLSAAARSWLQDECQTVARNKP